LSERSRGVPSVYVGRTIICDDQLKQLRSSPRFQRPPAFENALVQSIGGGNTMVLNRRAIDLISLVAPKIGPLVAHDWWIYQLVTGVGGNIIYDSEPMVLYRQHGDNLIGANDNPGAARARLSRVLRGQYRDWIDLNIQALSHCDHLLTDDARSTLAQVAEMRSGGVVTRLSGLWQSGLYRQGRLDTALLYVLALFKRF